MMRGKQRDERSPDRGAAAVEFAIIAPLLILLVFAIIGYGFMLSFRQAMSQAAAEGARAAAVAPGGLPTTGTATDTVQKRVLQAVNQGLGSYGVTCTDAGKLRHNNQDAGTCVITFSSSCSASTALAKCAKVALDYTYRDDSLVPSFPGLGIVLPENLNYTAEVEIS